MNLPLRGWLVLGGLALSAVLAYALLGAGLGRAPGATTGAAPAPSFAGDKGARATSAAPRGGAEGEEWQRPSKLDYNHQESKESVALAPSADMDEFEDEPPAEPAPAAAAAAPATGSTRRRLRAKRARKPSSQAADSTVMDLLVEGAVDGAGAPGMGVKGVGAGGGGGGGEDVGGVGLGTLSVVAAGRGGGNFGAVGKLGASVRVGHGYGAGKGSGRGAARPLAKSAPMFKSAPAPPADLPTPPRGESWRAATPPSSDQADSGEPNTQTIARNVARPIGRNIEKTLQPSPKPAEKRRAERNAALASEEAERARRVKPAHFLARTFYFENTYLGGDAAIAERTRRVRGALRAEGLTLPLDLATAGAQPLDPPAVDGMALYADLDQPWLERPGRVVLQVGLRGSDRYGWRRPPLDVVVVFAPGVAGQDPRGALQALASLAQRLGPRDRLGAVIAGAARGAGQLQRRFQLEPVRSARASAERLRAMGRAVLAATAQGASARRLPAALRTARRLLRRAAQAEAVVPGTRLVLLVTGGRTPRAISALRGAAEGLARDGAMVSVLELSHRTAGAWWQVAAAGHGNYRHATGAGVDAAVDHELADQSRVVARLVRLNIRLAKGVKAIRVLGSRVLDPREVARLKAREEAVDRQLSAAVGVESDRGEDDDGIQTVIPYFYGGDSHVVLVELWVEHPGPVADVTIKYKDMVSLRNATARASATLAATHRAATPVARNVGQNARGMRMAELLQRAGFAVAQGQRDRARALVEQARAVVAAGSTDEDRALLEAADALVERGGGAADISEALVVAGLRRAGAPRSAGETTRGGPR